MTSGLNYTGQEKAALTAPAPAGREKAAENKWEPPIPFGGMAVPAFPEDCLPAIIRNYVSAVAEATQTPADMAAVAALSVMAVCVQGKYRIQGKPDWTEPLNLYCAIVANPAERKSAVLSMMTECLHEYEREYNEKHLAEINRNKLERRLLEKEIDRLLDDMAKGRNKPGKGLLAARQDELTNFKDERPLRLLADDASPEALTSLLAANGGRMAVISSEGGIFETLSGRYSQTFNLDAFLKAHCGDAIRIDRKGRESEYVKEPCLTVLLSIQPQVLDGLVNNAVFRGRGLTARFLYSLPASCVGKRRFETKPIPERYKAGYRGLCAELLSIKEADAGTITLSDEARALSAAFAGELEPRLIGDLDGMADFAGKLHGAVLRIAGILHAVNQLVFAAGTPVPAETLEAAVRIGRYFLEHAKAAYSLMGADGRLTDARYVLRQLEKQDKRTLSKYEIFRKCQGRFKLAGDITPAVNALLEYGYLRAEEPERSGSGRPREPKYLLNPEIFVK